MVTEFFSNTCLKIPGRVTPHETDEFLREATRMKMFDHPNVLSLLGISVYEEVPCVILPFMSNGDLRTYMRNNQEVGKSLVLITAVIYFLVFRILDSTLL